MVKHIVMFRFDEKTPADVRKKAAEQFRAGILALKAIIPTICEIEVGFNTNPVEQWDICLYSKFETLKDVVEYGKHPEHVKVASALKPLLSGRSCVDYETDN